jgi:probable phosphoglycerate mutase
MAAASCLPREFVDVELPIVCLARHGETAWTVTGQHTGLTDLPLTARGEQEAGAIGRRLENQKFSHVFTSPLQRAMKTSQLAGFGAATQVDPLLLEWNYGQYDGRTSAEIRRDRPGWELFHDGCPGGETPDDVAKRADAVIQRVRAIQGNVLLFSSGHFLRVLAARWLGHEASLGRCLLLSTASLSVLGYEHDLSQPVIRLWNDTRQFIAKSS